MEEQNNLPKKRLFSISLLTKIFRVLFIIIIVVSTSVYVYKNLFSVVKTKASSSDPSLSLLPKYKGGQIGETFDVQIILNTKEQKVTAVKLDLEYSSEKIKITGFRPDPALPVILEPAAFKEGKIKVILGSQPNLPFQGSGILGSFTVKIINNGNSTIKFLSNTQVAVLEKNMNSLDSTTGIIINGN